MNRLENGAGDEIKALINTMGSLLNSVLMLVQSGDLKRFSKKKRVAGEKGIMCELVDALLREVEETTRLIEYEKGFAEGYRVGFQEGLQEDRIIKIEMLRKVRQEGLSDELIARVASSSIEQVREWCS